MSGKMGGFYPSKRELKYQSEMAEMFSDVEPPAEEQTEDAGEFSLNPIGFAEMTECLCRDAEVIFSQTAVRHRLSESFLKMTGNLEKLIRRLGSCCLTKAALEAKGQELPSLEGLDIRRLYCLGSYNFRKCHASIQDGISKQGKFNISMMQMECRWFTTLEQLKTTEERIILIREGKINVDSLFQRDSYFREHESSDPKEKDSNHTSFRKAPSFPILHVPAEGPAAPYILEIGTSREPKGNLNWGDAKVFRPMSPAKIRKQIEKERREKEAREKARQEREAGERSKQVVEEAVAATIAQIPGKQKTVWDDFKKQSEKSAVEKWNEILGTGSPPDERSGPGSSRKERTKQKKKKR